MRYGTGRAHACARPTTATRGGGIGPLTGGTGETLGCHGGGGGIFLEWGTEHPRIPEPRGGLAYKGGALEPRRRASTSTFIAGVRERGGDQRHAGNAMKEDRPIRIQQPQLPP